MKRDSRGIPKVHRDFQTLPRDFSKESCFIDSVLFRLPFRATRKSDLVMPDQARAVARELGVCYYETSVFTYYGVNEVFENSIRAALIARRQQRFWITNLKRVQRPLFQVRILLEKRILQIRNLIFHVLTVII